MRDQHLRVFLEAGHDSLGACPGLHDIEGDEIVGDIIRNFNIVIRRSFVGLIETGDIIFLFANDDNLTQANRPRYQGGSVMKSSSFR